MNLHAPNWHPHYIGVFFFLNTTCSTLLYLFIMLIPSMRKSTCILGYLSYTNHTSQSPGLLKSYIFVYSFRKPDIVFSTMVHIHTGWCYVRNVFKTQLAGHTFKTICGNSDISGRVERRLANITTWS